MRTSTPRRRDCGRCPPPRATSSSGVWEHVTWPAALQLDVALQTVHRHVHANLRLHQVSEEDVPAGSHGTRARCLCTRTSDRTP